MLAARGVASRRKAETLVAQGRVRVDGQLVRELGARVPSEATIEVDGKHVPPPADHRYVLLNKPRGVVATARDELGRATVVGLVGARERLYPVGRLDVDSEGLLLLTNDGDWAERVMHPRYGHEREYEVYVAGDVSVATVAALRDGVTLDEGVARAERVRLERRSARGGVLRIALRTGWKRQVRRMCEAVGIRVVRLRRVRIGPLALGALPPGASRELTPREVRALADARLREGQPKPPPPRLARTAGASRPGARLPPIPRAVFRAEPIKPAANEVRRAGGDRQRTARRSAASGRGRAPESPSTHVRAKASTR